MISAGWEGEGVWRRPRLELGFPSTQAALCSLQQARDAAQTWAVLDGTTAADPALSPDPGLPRDQGPGKLSWWTAGDCPGAEDSAAGLQTALCHGSLGTYTVIYLLSQGCRTVAWKVTGEGTGRRQHGSEQRLRGCGWEGRVCQSSSPCTAPLGWAGCRGRALPGGSPSEQWQGVILGVKKNYKHKCNPIEVICPNKKKNAFRTC